MKPVSEFFSRLLPYVPGCPEPLMEQALVDSAIAFCEDSKLIRGRIDTFTTQSGVATYSLDAPTQQRISRVISAALEGRAIPQIAKEDGEQFGASEGRPVVCSTSRVDSELVLSLHPTPDAVYTVDVVAAFCPVRGATRLDDDLFDRWLEPVLYGALYRIMRVPAQPFSDQAAAAAYLQMAVVATNKAKVEAQFDTTMASRRIRPVRFV